MPRSTLACPPAKNFTDQYLKPSQPSQPQLLSGKPSAATLSIKPDVEPSRPSKEAPVSRETPPTVTVSTTNQRPVSREVRQNPKTNAPREPPVAAKKDKGGEVHVKKWVDYSTKYGLGYLLSDGSTGVYFNDSTKIIVDKNGENFEYIEKKQGDKADTVTAYRLSDYPPER